MIKNNNENTEFRIIIISTVYPTSTEAFPPPLVSFYLRFSANLKNIRSSLQSHLQSKNSLFIYTGGKINLKRGGWGFFKINTYPCRILPLLLFSYLTVHVNKGLLDLFSGCCLFPPEQQLFPQLLILLLQPLYLFLIFDLHLNIQTLKGLQTLLPVTFH